MKKQLFTLLALLLVGISGAWGQITTLYSWESSGADAEDITQTGGTVSVVDGTESGKKDVINAATTIIGGTTLYVLQIQSKNDAKTGHTEIALNSALQEGDIVKISGFQNKDASNKVVALYLGFKQGDTEKGNYTETSSDNWVNLYNDANYANGTVPETRSYNVTAAMAGSNKLIIARSQSGTNLWISKVQIIRDSRTALTSFSFSGGTTAVASNATGDFVAPTLAAMNGEDNVTTTIASDISYASNNEEVATVNASTGAVTLTGTVGTAKITATLEDNDTYRDATANYTITVYAPLPNWIVFDGVTDEAARATTITYGGVSMTYEMSSTSVVDVSAKTNATGRAYVKGLQISKSTNGYIKFTIPSGYKATSFTWAFSGTGNRTIMLSTAKINSTSSDGYIATLTTAVTSGNIIGGNYTSPLAAGTYYICEGGSGNWQVDALAFNLEAIPGPSDPVVEGTTVTLGTTANMDGWRSYNNSSAKNYTVSANTKVYYASATGDSKVTLTEIEGGVPANTAVILHKTDAAGAAAEIVLTETATDIDAPGSSNELRVSTAGQDLGKVYRLGYKSSDGVGFYTYTTTSAPEGIVYVSSVSSANFLSMDFGETTGIESAGKPQTTTNCEFYNLAGQRVAQPTKGLYIVNGKKVLVK